MQPLAFGMLATAALLISSRSVLGAKLCCFRYEAEEVPLAKLDGDWYVQDYANAGNVFENQTCVKISFSVDPRGNAATFNKSWVDKWTKKVQHREFFIVQRDPGSIEFLDNDDPTWKITARILRLTADGTFIHSSCELKGPWVQNQRITTATRNRQVAREAWLKVYDSLGTHVFQSHSGVQQAECPN